MMKEILITSSALILALLVIRRVFKGVLSRRFQYALWGLVLVRLLVPVNLLPAADFSVLSAARPVEQAVAVRVNQPLYFRPQGQVSQAELSQRDIPVENIPTAQDGFVLGESKGFGQPTTGWLVRDPETNTVTRYAHVTLGPWEILNAVWKAGMVLMGTFFLLSNLWFYLRLRRTRRPYATLFEGGTRKVYLVPVGVIPSPCLFGRSIYITPAVAEDEDKLRHVLAHESTHAKHLDPLWSLLRCLCLTVYWFDPLVWVAAACSKSDCELACDESVLKALGEDQRIPYGQTLLSLIPVKRVGNPMLAATTMTAGKKQLKDRVTRIARQPRQLAAAALAVAALAVVVSACTFTGAKPTETADPAPTESQEPQGPRALTGQELRWFNEEFFNSSGSDQSVAPYATGGDDYVMYYNIRNQFISSLNLYDKPEDIDLYELFYCDGDAFSEADYQVLGLTDSPCAYYKLTSGQIDNILLQNTGLTLEQTNKVHFTYGYNDTLGAYVWGHGDTNYPGDIEIICGTREGSTVKLYHHGWGSGSEWYQTTLEEQSGGGYWFVSNRESETPAIPTPLPAQNSQNSVNVENPYTPPAVTVTPHVGDFIYSWEGNYGNALVDGHHIRIYRATDGNIYAAVELEDGTMNVFLDQLDETVKLSFFHDLFGHSGFCVDLYAPYKGSANSWPIRNYYYVTDDEIPVLLAQCPLDDSTEPMVLDLNGDGQNELISSRQIFFQRDGVVYEAYLPDIMRFVFDIHGQEMYWDFERWDKYSKCLYIRGYTEGYKEWERYLYFDGENILVYKNEKPTTDHMVDGISDGVPAAVVSAARDYAENVYIEAELALKEAELQELIQQTQPGELPPTYDDWRVEAFEGPYRTEVGEVTVEAWTFNYELHTTTPENVVLAGGKYITEDDWVSPGYPGCDWLFFQRKADGSLSYLWHAMINDMGPGSWAYGQYLEERLAELNFDIGNASFASLDAARKLEYIMDHSDGQVTLMLTPAEGEGAAYTVSPNEFNGRYYQRMFTDPEEYRWSFDYVSDYPEGTFLTITDPTWDYFIRIWEGSDLVMIKESNNGALWYRAEQAAADDVFSTDVFHLMRRWFDEVEIGALEQAVVIPDRGQGQERIAQELIEAYEGAHLKVLPGSLMAWTYAEVRDLRIDQKIARENYPNRLDGEEAFLVWYSTVFVPEGDPRWFMPGNTAEYEGNDVPDGALQWWSCAYLYLAEDGWRVDSVGTGP